MPSSALSTMTAGSPCTALSAGDRYASSPFTSLCTGSTHTHTHTHPFSGPLSRTTRVSRYQKGKTNLDFTEARDSEWQWHQLGYMQVCSVLQTDNHTGTPPLCFLQAGCPTCRPANSVKALKAYCFILKLKPLLYNPSVYL